MKLFLIGGFLGSGKTTAIQQACNLLLKKGTKVCVITNDQGTQLVDTEFIRSFNIPTLEVTDGCFCCNYDKLDCSIATLMQTHHPEIILAESVGSCTDLVATVVKPLSKFHPEIEISVSVFADARVLPLLIKGSRLFVDSVNYIYRKQLEEADLLVVNKVDIPDANQLEEIKQLVKSRYPHKTVLYQNSLEPESIGRWLEALSNFQTAPSKSLELDYDIYGVGEAELAWFDSEVKIISMVNNAFSEASELINKIYSKINLQKLSIGHLKFLLNDGKKQRKISFTSNSLFHQQFPFEESEGGEANLLINARVQTSPDGFKKIIGEAIEQLEMQTGCTVIEKKMAAFKPGFPKPTYRILD